MRKYEAIPEPSRSIDSLVETCKALKMAVEQLAGVRGSVSVSRVSAEDRPPPSPSKGDLWINQSGMKFWNGQEWQAVP